MTRMVPMIGHPVAQTKLPDSFNQHERVAALGLVMERRDVSPAELDGFVASVRESDAYAGFVSTIPHKSALAEMVDAWSLTVELTGVCNTVRRDGPDRLHGDMLDGHGMADALEAAGAELTGADVSVVGCGAAGTAIALEVMERGARRLEMTDIDSRRTDRLIGRLQSLDRATRLETRPPGERTGTVLINASPVGMRGEESPFSADELDRAAAAADAVTTGETALLAAAADRGLVTVDGAAMAAAQLAPLLRLLSDATPPSAPSRNP